MRYAKSHKQETKDRVLKIAAKALRENGPNELGVADVMRAAGLTHGGFYAHFASKDELLAESLSETFSQLAVRVDQIAAGLPPREALVAYIDFYVSRSHRDHPGRGCPLVALNSDLTRQTDEFREAFDTGIEGVVDRLTQWMTAIGLQQPRKVAISTLSSMFGAVALSRAVSEPQLSDDLLETARADIKSRLGLDRKTPH